MEIISKLKFTMPAIRKGRGNKGRALPDREQTGWNLLAFGLQKSSALIFKQVETEVCST